MRTVNFHYQKFYMGQVVVATKEYHNGLTHIHIGDLGYVQDITIENLPDFGLFNIKIIHLKFGNHEFGLNQTYAKEYVSGML